ncbi:hypothetical protein V6N13_078322 [Hibiscus sabdariffa]
MHHLTLPPLFFLASSTKSATTKNQSVCLYIRHQQQTTTPAPTTHPKPYKIIKISSPFLSVLQIQAKTQISMATLTSFFRWFSGSNKKVASQGDDSSPREPKAANEAKSKENNADKSPPIPMSYFPIGTRFSLL